MAGVKGQKGGGGARPGAGRKSTRDEQELKALLDSAWPLDDRIAAVKRTSEIATAGDVISFKTLMAYAYGTPPSGDDLKTEEAVDNALETILSTLEESLTPQAWAEVRHALGLEADAAAKGAEKG